MNTKSVLTREYGRGRRLRNLVCWLALTLVLGACAARGPVRTAPTKTAQATRAIGLATQMAGRLASTYTAVKAESRATAQARQSFLDMASRWPRVLRDPFDALEHDWALGKEADPLADIEWSLVDGKYRWEAQAQDSFVWWVYPEMEPVTDFYLSVSMASLEGPASAEQGVIFHHTDENDYYLFELNRAGEFALFIHYLGEWETLLDWHPAEMISNDEANELTVIANNSHYALYINQQWVGDYFDDRLPSGTVGLLVGLSEAGDEGLWEFDNFALHAPFDLIPEVQTQFSTLP